MLINMKACTNFILEDFSMFNKNLSSDELRQQFDKKHEHIKKYKKSFHELFLLLIKDKHINSSIFCDKTLLSPMTYSRYKRGKQYPSMRAIITMAIAFDLDMPMVETLLLSAGYAFDLNNKVHYAYQTLVKDYQGKSIYECNDYLAALGIEKKDFLGDKTTTED